MARRLVGTMPDIKKEEGLPSFEEATKTLGVSPLMYRAAQVQKFLGETPTLPIAFSLPTMAIPIPGVRGAVSAAAWESGERAKKLLRGELRPEEYKGLKGMLPTKEEVAGMGLGAALDLLTSGAWRLIKGGGPRGILGEARRKAAEKATEKVSATEIAKAGEDYLRRHPDAATKGTQAVIEGLKKERVLDVDDALQRSIRWNTAYTKMGEVGKSMKAGFYDALTRAAKEEIARVAPEVAKKTELLRLTYDIPRAIARTTWTGAKLGAAAGGLGYLGRLLGLF